MNTIENVFTKVGSGISKATTFLLAVFTKTSEVNSILTKLAPATQAALLATFYDTIKTAASASAAAADASTGNFTGAVTLSANTTALIENVIADVKTDGSVIAADLTALGIKL